MTLRNKIHGVSVWHRLVHHGPSDVTRRELRRASAVQEFLTKQIMRWSGGK